MLALDDTNFDACIKRNHAVLVDCYQIPCHACDVLAPVIDQFSATQNKVTVYKLNTARAPKIAGRYSISATPTLLYFIDGKLKTAYSGATDLATLQKLYPGT